MSGRNWKTWWGQNAEEMIVFLKWALKDSDNILEYIEQQSESGNMSDFEVLEDIMCGSYVDGIISPEEGEWLLGINFKEEEE